MLSTGIESATLRSLAGRSNQLSYTAHSFGEPIVEVLLVQTLDIFLVY